MLVVVDKVVMGACAANCCFTEGEIWMLNSLKKPSSDLLIFILAGTFFKALQIILQNKVVVTPQMPLFE